MLPMISDVSEVDEAVALISKAHQELSDKGIDVPYPVIGLMIEVPSAVYQMNALAKRADFFSVGSNDLTQYLLAVDRNNKQVSNLYNSMHPSVLHSIQQIVTIAHKFNRPVSVCGEMAGEPASALALAGMKVDSLSMSVSSLSRVKLAIRSFTFKQIENLSVEALAHENAEEIRMLFNKALENAGVGRLVRARQ
jgi:phosphotransferase system enzyme I (PtsP)